MYFKFIAELPEGEEVCAMCAYKGEVIIATTRRLFELVDDQLITLKLKVEDKESTPKTWI